MCCDHAPRDRRQPQHRATGFRGCAKEHPRIGWIKSNWGPVPIWIEPPPGRPRAPCRRDCEFRVRERFLEGFAGSYESAAKHNFLATPDKTNPRKWRQAPSFEQIASARVASVFNERCMLAEKPNTGIRG